jgi:hypothetical protein
MSESSLRPSPPATLGAALLSAALGGCVANSSNPVIAIESAAMNATEADILLDLTNPGGRDLDVLAVQYELSHGEMGFPVAQGTWEGELFLPAGGHVDLPMHIVFDTELMEPESRALHLNGGLSTHDRTGFLGLASMDLGTTSFQLDTVATEKSP